MPKPNPERLRWLPLLLAALFTPTVLFVTASGPIIRRNALDLPYQPSTGQWFLTALGIGVLLSVPWFLLARLGRAWEGMARLLLLSGVCTLLFNLSDFVMTRAGTRSVLSMLAFDGLLVALAALILLGVAFSTLARLFAMIAVLFLVFGGVAHWSWSRDMKRDRQAVEATAVAGSDSAVAGPRGNVYHIVLDGFQRELFQILRERNPELETELAGFTYYDQFTTDYGMTVYSVVNALTGRSYVEGESLHEWMVSAKAGGLWKALAENGAQLRVYPYFHGHGSPLATTSEPTKGTSFDSADPTRKTIDLWFLSLLPRSARVMLVPALLHDRDIETPQDAPEASGFSITDLVWQAEQEPLIADGDFAALSVRHADRILEREKDVPDTGQYLFFHGMIPHEPFVMDRSCKYRGRGEKPFLPEYLEQAACSLRIIARLVARLKELDRFDDSLIIVHSDHGGPGVVWRELTKAFADRFWPETAGASKVKWTNPVSTPVQDLSPHVVDLRSAALLLVKLPGSQEMTTVSSPAQMRDIAPTILRHVGLSTEGYPGIPLQELPGHPNREIEFIWGIPDLPKEVPVGMHFARYILKDGRWHFQDKALATE
ncbi:MAG: sulfatase-like hydrolase/transferase [bacterium]|nr:sulfatase-like hydrolase/transferase [bacterium]